MTIFNLNCSPGDLAIVVKGREDCLGKIVVCIAQIGTLEVLPVKENKNIWKIDKSLPYFYSNLGRDVDLEYCPDEYLKPIRYQDSDDEMIALAGKPMEKVEV